VKSVKVAHYALRELSGMIADFPVKGYVGGYSDADIAAARKWLKEHDRYDIIR
jgi:hypothetical protein